MGLIARGDTPEANQVVTALLASLEKRPDGPGTKEIIEALARFGPKAASSDTAPPLSPEYEQGEPQGHRVR